MLCANGIGRANSQLLQSAPWVPLSKVAPARPDARKTCALKIYIALASPFSRKVRVTVAELGLCDEVEYHLQDPREDTESIDARDPLACVPTLETDDGQVICDSVVICEYLNALAGGALLPPGSDPARWDAGRRHALGDGILHSAFPLHAELLRDQGHQDPALIAREETTLQRTFDALDEDPATRPGRPLDLGAIAIGCALGWLDLRFPHLHWRAGRPRLAAWMEHINARPSFQSTRPA